MLNNLHLIGLKNEFDACNIYRTEKTIDAQGYPVTSAPDIVLEGVLIDIQGKKDITDSKTEIQAGVYYVKSYRGYTAVLVDVKMGDTVENTRNSKKYEVLDVIDKRDYQLLLLQEVVINE